MSNSTALVPVPVLYQSIAKDPQRSLEFIDQMVQKIQGGMKGVNTKGKATVAALIMLTEGLTIPEMEAKYHFMDGGGTQLASTWMLAQLELIGAKPKWIEDGEDGQRATLQVIKDGEEKRVTFTIEMARRKGLVRSKSQWDTDPPVMLRARATSRCVDMHFPTIRAGCVEEEYDNSVEVSQAEMGKTRRSKSSVVAEVVTQVPSGNGSHAAPHTAAEEADFDVVSTAEAPFGEPDAAASQEAGESFVEEETGANDTLPTKDAAASEAASEPVAQPHAVIENGTIRSSEAKADPAIINEIRDLCGSDPTLRMIGQRALGEYGLNEVRSLTDIQARQTLALILTHKAGLGERLHKALEKFGTHDITKLTAAQANDMIGALRAKIRKDAEAAAQQTEMAGAAAGN